MISVAGILNTIQMHVEHHIFRKIDRQPFAAEAYCRFPDVSAPARLITMSDSNLEDDMHRADVNGDKH